MNALVQIVDAIRRDRFAHAATVLLCGSFVRGEASVTSDLDLVVLFPNVAHAWRESFTLPIPPDGYRADLPMAGRLPVECFCHDPETAEYFFREVDRPSGVGALMHMVLDGIAVPDCPLAEQVKQQARAVHAAGPPPWRTADIDASRYLITNHLDDLIGAAARPGQARAEIRACATLLYPALAGLLFRSANRWSATGKSILPRLRAWQPELAERFEHAFDRAFGDAVIDEVVALSDAILAPHGGRLFAGYRSDAPSDHRLALPPPTTGPAAP